MGVFEPVDDSLGNQDFLGLVAALGLHAGDELFFALDDLVVLAVPQELQVDLGLEGRHVDLGFGRLADLLRLLVSHK